MLDDSCGAATALRTCQGAHESARRGTLLLPSCASALLLQPKVSHREVASSRWIQ